MSEHLALFAQTYRRFLADNYEKHPNEFGWPLAELDAVADRMTAAFKAGTFNKDSRSIRDACRELGIKHTYKAIAEYFVAQ